MSSLSAFEKAPETNRGRMLYRMLLAVHAGIRSELLSVEHLAAAVVDGLSVDGLNEELEALRSNSRSGNSRSAACATAASSTRTITPKTRTSSANWRRRTRR